MRNLVLLPFVLFLLPSCQQAGRSADSVTQIKATIDNYYTDIRKKGLIAELDYLDSSDQFFWVPPGYLDYILYDSVARVIRKNAGAFQLVDNRYDSLLVIPLSKGYAQFAMRTMSTTVTASGDTSHTRFIESGVMVKRKQGWKFLSGQTSILP